MQAKKNKIVHITSSLKMGGAERVLFQLVKAEPFEHVVIYFHHGPFVQRIADLGVKVIKIDGLICRYDPIFFWRLVCAVRKENPDVIHALLWAANIAARMCALLLRKPVVTAYHNNPVQDGFVRSLLDRLTIKFSTKHIAVSEVVAQSVFARASWLPASRIEVISNGITMPIQCMGLQKKDLGLPSDAFVVGAVGRFVALKRFDLLLEVAAECIGQQPRVRVVLVGVGPEESALRRLAIDLKIADRVVFVVGKDASAYYSVFDCFIQCSDNEGISIALLEAMSFALPSVVMGNSFVHPVVTHNVDGLVCVPGDKEMLAAYIILLIMHPQEARALAQQGCLTVQRTFNEQEMIDTYAKAFNGLIDENSK